MKVDITIDDSTEAIYSLVHYSTLFTDWVLQRISIVKHLKSLALILKTMLSKSQLNIPYHGKYYPHFNRRIKCLRIDIDGICISKYLSSYAVKC